MSVPGPSITSIEIGALGRLELCVEMQCLGYRAQSGEVAEYPGHALLRETGGLRWATSGRRGQALLGRVEGEELHQFDARTRAFRAIPIGERLRRAEQLQIVESGDLFLALSENGILAIDERGEELWRIGQVTYDWSYVGRDESGLSLCDAHGNLLVFDPQTGRESSG